MLIREDMARFATTLASFVVHPAHHRTSLEPCPGALRHGAGSALLMTTEPNDPESYKETLW